MEQNQKGRFRIDPAALAIGDVCAGKKSAKVLQGIHIAGGPGNRQIVEATDGVLAFRTTTSTRREEDDFGDYQDAIVGRSDAKSIIAKASGDTVAVETELREAEHDGDERHRITRATLSDGTEVSLRAPADKYPELDAHFEREALRPRLRFTLSRVHLARAAKRIASLSDADNVELSVPIAEPTGSIRILAEDGPDDMVALIRPVSEFTSRVGLRFAELCLAVAGMVDAANDDAGLAMTALDRDQFVKSLNFYATKAKSNIATKADGGEEPNPQQTFIDECAGIIEAHRVAEEEKAKAAKEAAEDKTPGMKPPDDPNVFDAEERHCARPEESEDDPEE